MGRLKLFLICAALLLTLTSTASALSLTTSGIPVLMIDGGDGDASVSVFMSDLNPAYTFGYMDAGSFVALDSGAVSFDGGTVVDFGIRDHVSEEVILTSAGTATMVFSGFVEASNSQNPVVTYDYWQYLTITWALNYNDAVITISGTTDGFAPVPEPTTMLLLGTGLAGVVAIHRRKIKKT